MPKRAPKVLHVARGWRDFGVRNKQGERVVQRKEEMCFIDMEDLDAHCPGAWHDQEHRYWAGVAASGRAECRKCGQKIGKGSLRLGLPRKQASGTAGYIVTWHHLECCRVEGLSAVDLAPLVYFEEALDADPEKRKKVLDTLTATTVPECAQAIDPTDDSFMGEQTELPRATAPAALQAKLLPFQEKGLGWMVKQELGDYRGGILADDMGLGKTIQTIALLLDAKSKSRKLSAAAAAEEHSGAAEQAATRTVAGPTLVVAPTSALIQWSEEIERFAGKELSVLIYYDKRDAITAEQLKSHDVVLTTYPVAEVEWRSEDNLTKVPCIHCDKYFQPDRLKWHNMYQCGPDAQRTSKQMKTERKRGSGAISGDAAAKADSAKSDTDGTIDLNLGGLPFLQGVAAPHPSLAGGRGAGSGEADSGEAAAGSQPVANKRSPAATPAEDPRTITDVYRKYMHEAGRKPVKMYEAAHRARAAAAGDSEIDRDGDDSSNCSNPTMPAAASKCTPSASSIKLEPSDPLQQAQKHSIDIDSCPDPWTCKACTLNNSGYLDYCEACHTPKALVDTTSEPGDKSSITASAAARLPAITSKADPAKGTEGGAEKRIKKRKQKKKKEKGGPKRAISSYFYYASEVRATLKEQHPEATVQDISRMMGIGWKSLSAKEKGKFESLAAKDKERYAADKAVWDELHQPAVNTADAEAEGNGEQQPEQKQEDSDDDFEPVAKPKRQRVHSGTNSRLKNNSTAAGIVRHKKTANPPEPGRKSSSQAVGGDDDVDSDLEICHPTMSQYNFQTDHDERPVAWEGTDLTGSKLHSVVWERIVLDEAHKIKGRTTNIAKSIYALRSEYKWALTGTPLQNNVGELWGLVRFLKMHPWAYYFCRKKGCDCRLESWTFRRNERRCRQPNCRCRSFSHYSYFSTHIIKPIQNNGFAGSGKEAMLKLRNEVLFKIQLRRTKALVGKEINLPPLTIKIVKVHMRDDERDFYEGIYKQQKLRYDTFAEKGTVLNNYAHIFELLGRMRQACDHPSLIVHGSRKSGDKLLPARTRTEQVGDLCGICTDLVGNDDLALAKCGHVFHHECIGSFVQEVTAQKQKPTCPTCHKPLTVTVQLHDGADTARKDEAQIKRQLTRLGKEGDAASPTTEPGADADTNGKDENGRDLSTLAQHTSAKRQKRTDHHATSVDGSEEDSSDEEAELARALAMSMCERDEDGPKDEPDEDLRNVGNEDEIENEELAVDQNGAAGGTARAEVGSTDGKPQAVANTTATGGLTGGGVMVGRSNFMSRIDVAQFETSSKLSAVVGAIAGVKEKSQGKGKSIVFSQFVNMLDLVEWQLRKSGMNPVKLVGSMPPAQRASVLAAFKTNPKVDVILLSLRAGGEGLNLQCATHVFLLDPWWNPAVEMQAIQRAHRIGQTQPVEAQRFCVADSIEDDMLKIQEKKRLVFEGTVDGKVASMAKLTLKDLAFFFKN